MTTPEERERELIVAVLNEHSSVSIRGWCDGCDWEPTKEQWDAANSATELLRGHQADVIVERLGLA